MKRRELESKLSDLGWRFLRHGGSHDIWARGEETIPVPRHTEINENLGALDPKTSGRETLNSES